MKKFNLLILTIIISLFTGFQGCSKSPSAVDLLVGGRDPVEALRLPDKPEAGKKDTASDSSGAPTDDESEAIDLSPIDKMPEQVVSKWVVVSGNHVPLRKGPGVKFKRVGVATKGLKFKFIRIAQQEGKKTTWYLVENDSGEKLFISSLLAKIVTQKEEAPVKIARQEKKAGGKESTGRTKDTINKAKEMRPENFRSVLDPTPPLPPELAKAKHITLNFEGTEIYDVITTFCELLKIDYIIEGAVKGKITLQTFSKIPAKDLYSVFEQILAINNITVVRSGNFYRFLPAKQASKKALSIYYGNDPLVPANERMIIQIIPLKNRSAESMKKILAPLLSVNATLLDVPGTTNLMLIEMASNVRKIIRIVQTLDVDKLASADIQLFKINHSESQMVADELDEIFTTIGYGDALGKSLTFLPINRLNSIMTVSTLENVSPIIDFWIEKLDQPIAGSQLSTFVYYVQNADAERLSTIVNALFNDKKTDQASIRSSLTQKSKSKKIKKVKTKGGKSLIVKGGVKDEFEGELFILPDKDTNSLIIRTNPRNYPALLELIKKLDLLPQQVLIEVLIMDLTIDDQTKLGLEWAMQGSTNSGATVAGGSHQTTTGTSLGSQIGSSITPLFTPGASFFVQNPGRMILLLQAFASDSKVNVLANPILVTSDNKEASISISDDIPIESTSITQITGGEPLVQSTIEFKNVGVKLGILPKINSDNFVNLKINQEISSVGAIQGTTGTPSFGIRTVKTEVVLKDNQILVMGGLMRNSTSEITEGIPGLKDIPGIGWLFGRDIIVNTKTELMLFIIPHIISNTDDSNFITDQFKRRLTSLSDLVNTDQMAQGEKPPS